MSKVTRQPIEYRAAPYGLIAVIPKGTEVVEAKNLPARDKPRWWALAWPGIKESEEAWLRNYGFLLDDWEVEAEKEQDIWKRRRSHQVKRTVKGITSETD